MTTGWNGTGGLLTTMDREKRTLFLVDGSATYLFYTAMLLKRLDYTVQTSTSPDSALRAMAGSPPSLVITDTAFPAQDGVNLLQRIKQDARLKSVPVIIHTSEDSPLLKEDCLRTGCAAYFKKPADPDVLYGAIQAAIEARPRRNIRIETFLRVEVGGARKTEYAIALSEGGLYLKTRTPHPVHSIVPLKLFVREREINVNGEVLYISMKVGGQHKEPGMGMKFIGIDIEDREFLGAFIKEQITEGLSF
jgi:CheY-like chemotaxis protein